MHQHVAALLGEGQRGLAFEVEVLLAAHFERAFDDGLRGGEAGGEVAAAVFAGALLETGVGGERVVDGEQGGMLFVGDLGEAGGLAGGEVGLGHDEEDRLADVVDLAGGEQGLVVGGRGDVVGGGQVFGGEHGHHAGGGADGAEIEAGHGGTGLR